MIILGALSPSSSLNVHKPQCGLKSQSLHLSLEQRQVLLFRVLFSGQSEG